MDTPVDQSFDVDMYDIDLFDNDQDVVAALQEQGRTVVCYVNAGGWENWRPDEVLGANLDDWEGERWLDIRRLDLLAPIMEARMDLCKAKGFDGIEPHNVDGYLNDTGFSLTYDDQLRYNIWWANAAHERGLSVGLKNDMDQISDLLPYFDWALNEQCFEYDECETLLPFIDAGKPVFHVEYELDTGQFCETANALNFNSLRKQLELDAWRESCRNRGDIRLTTSLDTVYYIVSGETTEEIFDSVKANGPDAEAQVEGRITAGLAESDRSYNFEYLDLGAYCELQSADINMRLVVTLPSHQDTSALSDIQLTRWQGFAEGVAIHEQHHVDIYTERIESFKNRLESLPEQFSNCDLLRSSIATAWELESALDEQEQAAFHQSEEQPSSPLATDVVPVVAWSLDKTGHVWHGSSRCSVKLNMMGMSP